MEGALDADGAQLDQHVAAIGTLVVNMNRLESVVVDLIGIFMEVPSVLHVVAAFSHQQLSRNLDTLLALWTLGDFGGTPTADHMTDLLGRAKGLAEFRNSVVHAQWVTDDDGVPLAVRFQARGRFKRTRTPTTAGTILQRAREVKQISEELRGLRDHLHNRMSAGPAPV